MTKKEAQERNWKILRLLSISSKVNLLPDDIKNMFTQEELTTLELLERKIITSIHSARAKKFVCLKCSEKHNISISQKPTTNKKAYECDYCGDLGDWGRGLDLFCIK